MQVNNDKVMERLARELGALTINSHIADLEKESLQLQVEADAVRIDGLTKRVLEQDKTIQELRALLGAREKKAPRPDGKNAG